MFFIRDNAQGTNKGSRKRKTKRAANMRQQRQQQPGLLFSRKPGRNGKVLPGIMAPGRGNIQNPPGLSAGT